jgi:general secretion pathway protein C
MNLSASLRDLSSPSTQSALARTYRALPYVVSGLLAVAIAWQLARLTSLFLGGDTAPAVSSGTSGAAGESPQQAAVDVQRIVNAHLFGVPSAEPERQQDIESAPQTQMNLVLAGTLAEEDPQRGIAIIGESSTSAKVYSVGDTIRSGTRLHAVYTDRVILDRGGRLETLMLPRPSLSGAAGSNAPPPRRQVAAASRGEGGGPANLADNLRRIAETNPGALAEVVRPQPVFANGVQRGYRVYPGRNRQQFAKLGLQPGDLVTSINGTPLDDPARGMEIFNSLGSSDQVEVTVERNGETQQLTLKPGQAMLSGAEDTQPSGDDESGTR